MTKLRVIAFVLALSFSIIGLSGCEPCPLWQQTTGGC